MRSKPASWGQNYATWPNGMTNGGPVRLDTKTSSVRSTKGSSYPMNRLGRRRFTISTWSACRIGANSRSSLGEVHIGTGIHYPVPLHLQNAYASLQYGEGSFPVTERVAAEILSLPMFPGLADDQQSRVVQKVTELVSLATVTPLQRSAVA